MVPARASLTPLGSRSFPFEQRRKRLDELGRAGAVDSPVVAAEAHQHGWSNVRRTLMSDDPIRDASDGKDPGLTLGQDRGEEVDAVHAQVADRERPARQVRRTKPPGLHPLKQLPPLRR
jgi:hypothetical protein